MIKRALRHALAAVLLAKGIDPSEHRRWCAVFGLLADRERA